MNKAFLLSFFLLNCCGENEKSKTVYRDRETVRSPTEVDYTPPKPPYFRHTPPPPPPSPVVVVVVNQGNNRPVPAPKPTPVPVPTYPPIYQQTPAPQQPPQQYWCKCGDVIRTCTWTGPEDSGCYIVYGEDRQ